jgi:hypothetical protein
MGWEVSDAGSANGILWNGKPTPGSVLRTGDVVTIGETQLEFIASEAGTQVLLAPPTSPGAVALKQASTPGLSAAGGVPGSSRVGSGAALKNPRTLLLTAGVILAAIFLFEEEKPKGRPAATGPKPLASAARDLSSYLPRPGETVPGGKTAEGFFKSGFREYRLGNYLRARAHFETTLQLEPGHLLASIYLENSKMRRSSFISIEVASASTQARSKLLEGISRQSCACSSGIPVIRRSSRLGISSRSSKVAQKGVRAKA